MSETEPQLITDSDGHTPTALELVHDFILSITPAAESGTNLFMAYNQDAEGRVIFVEETPGQTLRTHGKAVALEFAAITVTVRDGDDDYRAAKDEIQRLRYRIAAATGYTSRGLTILDAEPRGGIDPIGRDIKDREAFQANFWIMTEPSYE
jgi:hypothetical protein